MACQTPQTILQTAQELIWSNSYHATGVDAICKLSGVKKGSFYHHFPSKEALTIAVIKAQAEGFAQALDEIEQGEGSAMDKLRAFARWSLEIQAQQYRKTKKVLGCPIFTLGSELASTHADIQDAVNHSLDQNLGFFERLVSQAQDQGDISCDISATMLAASLLSLSKGAVTLARIRNSLEPLEQLEESFIKLTQ